MNAARTSAGRRVLLTRSEEDSAAWAEALERRGLIPVVLPCIAAETVESPGLERRLTEETARADWLVFTSRRGVESYARLIGAGGRVDGDSAGVEASPGGGAAGTPRSGPAVAAVGPATADAARTLLGRADLVGGDGTAAGLARTLIDRLSRDAEAAGGATATTAAGVREATADRQAAARPRVVLVLAENARDTLHRRLTEAGLDCERFDVYRTVPAAAGDTRRPLSSLGVDTVFLASPSAVAGFVNRIEPDASAALVTIGPSTSEAAREAGLEVAAEAREPSLEGLLEAMP